MHANNPNNRSRRPSQRSILKSNSDLDDNQPVAATPTRQIYAQPGEQIGQETMREIYQVVNRQNSDPSGASGAERIIIIDRRGASTPDDALNISGNDRLRTFEIRPVPTPATPATPTSPATPSNPVAPAATPSAAPSPAPIVNSVVPSPYAVRPNVYYSPAQLQQQQQQQQYQQQRMYGSVPANLYGNQQQFAAGARGFYPMMYYHYWVTK